MKNKISLIIILSVIAVTGVWLMKSKTVDTGTEQVSGPAVVEKDSGSSAQKVEQKPEQNAEQKATQKTETSSLLPSEPSTAVQPNAGAVSAVTEVSQKQPACYIASFKAEKVDKKAPEKKNTLELSGSSLRSKEFCVRVDDKPVKFVIQKKELWIGGIESLDQKVTLEYCDSGAKLKNNCAIPKDEFLAAMAGESGEDADVAGQWAQNSGMSAEEQSAEREIASFADALTGDSVKNFFTKWKMETTVESSK